MEELVLSSNVEVDLVILQKLVIYMFKILLMKA